MSAATTTRLGRGGSTRRQPTRPQPRESPPRERAPRVGEPRSDLVPRICNWLAYTSSPRSYRSFAMAASQTAVLARLEGPGCEVDPLRCPGGPAARASCRCGCHIVAEAPLARRCVASEGHSRGSRGHRGSAWVVHLTVPGNDNLGIQREELIEEVDPVAAVDLGVIGGKYAGSETSVSRRSPANRPGHR